MLTIMKHRVLTISFNTIRHYAQIMTVLCIYRCVCVCKCVCYIYIYSCWRSWRERCQTRVSVFVYVCLSLYMCVCLCICVSVLVHVIHVCMCLYMCFCFCTCLCLYAVRAVFSLKNNLSARCDCPPSLPFFPNYTHKLCRTGADGIPGPVGDNRFLINMYISTSLIFI